MSKCFNLLFVSVRGQACAVVLKDEKLIIMNVVMVGCLDEGTPSVDLFHA